MAQVIRLHGKYGRGKCTIVDGVDFDWLNSFRWRVDYHGYVFRLDWAKGKNLHISMHRLILDPPSGLLVDHINHDPLDNRRENLRIVTKSQNGRNSRGWEKSSSTYKGVSFMKARSHLSAPWMACITTNGRSKYIGVYETEIEAAKAYDVAATKYHGEFACLNFP